MSFINTISTARPVVIGIDHGFGNIKTAHSCFKTGVTAYDQEPTFKSNLLVYDGRYYIIGDDHKEFTADKSQDQDYYILTLAAIAVELRFRDLTSARVYLAAGLPLTWVSGQKDSFRAYLLQKDSVDFSFRGVDYHRLLGRKRCVHTRNTYARIIIIRCSYRHSFCTYSDFPCTN